MTINAWQPGEFKPIKEREYRMYLLWKSLPLAMRRGGSEYLENVGIEDEDMHELVNIRSQTEFSRVFGVDMGTLSDWNRQEPPMEYQEINWRTWAKKLAGEVLQKLWEGIEERKDPASIKLYMQLIGEYTETSKVQVDYTTDLFDGMRQLVQSMNSPEQPAIEAVARPVEPISHRSKPKRQLKPREKTIPELLRETRMSDPQDD
jgi:hypothetical protein